MLRRRALVFPLSHLKLLTRTGENVGSLLLFSSPRKLPGVPLRPPLECALRLSVRSSVAPSVEGPWFKRADSLSYARPNVSSVPEKSRFLP
jgi:hypothetical protein